MTIIVRYWWKEEWIWETFFVFHSFLFVCNFWCLFVFNWRSQVFHEGKVRTFNKIMCVRKHTKKGEHKASGIKCLTKYRRRCRRRPTHVIYDVQEAKRKSFHRFNEFFVQFSLKPVWDCEFLVLSVCLQKFFVLSLVMCHLILSIIFTQISCIMAWIYRMITFSIKSDVNSSFITFTENCVNEMYEFCYVWQNSTS